MALISAVSSRAWHVDHAARVAASIEASRLRDELGPAERPRWLTKLSLLVSQCRPAWRPVAG